jgi:hypothetical protein
VTLLSTLETIPLWPFPFRRRRLCDSADRVCGGIGVVLLSVLGLQDLRTNSFYREVFNLAVCKQGVDDGGVRFGEGDEDSCGELEVVQLETIQGTVGAELNKTVDLRFESSVVDERSLVELAVVIEAGDRIALLIVGLDSCGCYLSE